MKQRLQLGLRFAALLLALLVGGVGSGTLHAQGSVQIIDRTGTGVTVTPSCVVNHNCLDVNIASGGGSGGTASSFGAAFPATGTAIGVKNGANMVNLAADGSANLLVNCAVGCSASAGFADNSAFTAGSTAFSPVGGWYSTSVTNCSDGSACTLQITLDRKLVTQAFQGGTWTINSITNPVAVTGTFWQATQPVSGTFFQATQPVSIAGTVAVSGPLTDTQLRATAVPVSLASAPSTSVTQGTSPWVVGQATGTNLHTVVDSGTVTVSGTVTANAGSNLNTSALQLDATGAALNLAQGSTTSGQTGPLVQTATTTSAPTYTTAKTNPLSTDVAGNLRVTNTTALVAGSNVIGHVINDASSAVIGHVIADSGSTTAVTGNVTVTQGTGTNLHAVLDSGTTTVTQGTGTNLHAVLDSTSTTAVTQGTASNLNAAVVGTGTAGSAAGGVLTVQGVASMTKLLVTPDSVALPANQSVNVAQINAVTPLMGNGTTGTGSQRVTIASDNTAFAVNATLAAETTKVIGTARIIGNAGAVLDAATGAAPPANAMLSAGLGSGATGGDLVGMPVGDTYKNINISTATTTLLVAGVASRQVRISAIHMITALANNVALIEGTGATCGTGTAGMAGGTTAASGYNLAANGGLTMGTGVGTVIATTTAGDSVCAVTSASTQLSGGIEYAIY